MVHARGKKAYVFYDDHWIGVEPYSPHFKDFGFDGLIKCVFNAFEVRKCAHATGVKIHELRLHPYLFPTGLQGRANLQAGWQSYTGREELLDRRPPRHHPGADRPHRRSAVTFRSSSRGLSSRNTSRSSRASSDLLKSFHQRDSPYTAPFKVAILTAWGSLRSWQASGHLIPGLDYGELLESLAGLPLDIVFISFDDLLANGVPKDVKVIVNCGREGSAWSGGHYWREPRINELLTQWVQRGGGFVGISEPSAAPEPGQLFKLSASPRFGSRPR